MALWGRGSAARTDTATNGSGAEVNGVGLRSVANGTAVEAPAANGSTRGVDVGDGPGARTIGAMALQRWAARRPGKGPGGGDVDEPTRGPYDEDDLDPEQTSVGLVDFGAVRVPVPRDGEVGVEPEEGRLQAVHVMLPAGRLSVSALAAPRTGRLWPDLAAEIDESLREGGATVRSFTGEWGRELHARTGEAASVFVGVDGPRWMLYGVATGPSAAAAELDDALRRMLRGTVVVRGRLPYPVRTVLPLTVPEHLAARLAGPRVPAARTPEPPVERTVRRPSVLGRTGRGRAVVPPPEPPRAAPPSRPALPAAPPAAPPPDEATVPRRVTPFGPAAAATNGRPGPARPVAPPPPATSSGPSFAPAADRPRPPAPAAPPAAPSASPTGQRRVSELLAEAERERAARAARDRSGPARGAARPGTGPQPGGRPGAGYPEAGYPDAGHPGAGRPGDAFPAPDRRPAAPPPDRPRAAPEPSRAPYPSVEYPSVEYPSVEPAPPAGPPQRSVDAAGPAWPDPHRGAAGPEPRPAPPAPAAPVPPPAAPSPSFGPPAARPAGDGADDWTVPMTVVPFRAVPPAPAPAADPLADAPWVAEARRVAQQARVAEEADRAARAAQEADRAARRRAAEEEAERAAQRLAERAAEREARRRARERSTDGPSGYAGRHGATHRRPDDGGDPGRRATNGSDHAHDDVPGRRYGYGDGSHDEGRHDAGRYHGAGYNGTPYDGTRYDGTRYDGTGYDGARYDAIGYDDRAHGGGNGHAGAVEPLDGPAPRAVPGRPRHGADHARPEPPSGRHSRPQ